MPVLHAGFGAGGGGGQWFAGRIAMWMQPLLGEVVEYFALPDESLVCTWAQYTMCSVIDHIVLDFHRPYG